VGPRRGGGGVEDVGAGRIRGRALVSGTRASKLRVQGGCCGAGRQSRPKQVRARRRPPPPKPALTAPAGWPAAVRDGTQVRRRQVDAAGRDGQSERRRRHDEPRVFRADVGVCRVGHDRGQPADPHRRRTAPHVPHEVPPGERHERCGVARGRRRRQRAVGLDGGRHGDALEGGVELAECGLEAGAVAALHLLELGAHVGVHLEVGGSNLGCGGGSVVFTQRQQRQARSSWRGVKSSRRGRPWSSGCKGRAGAPAKPQRRRPCWPTFPGARARGPPSSAAACP
jgi:hypothetical protein